MNDNNKRSLAKHFLWYLCVPRQMTPLRCYLINFIWFKLCKKTYLLLYLLFYFIIIIFSVCFSWLRKKYVFILFKFLKKIYLQLYLFFSLFSVFVFHDCVKNDDSTYPSQLTQHYTMTKKLGEGTFGEVRLAYRQVFLRLYFPSNWRICVCYSYKKKKEKKNCITSWSKNHLAKFDFYILNYFFYFENCISKQLKHLYLL